MKRQNLAKSIIKQLEDYRALYDWNGPEVLEPIDYFELKRLRHYIKEKDLTASSISMAIMYLNQTLLYAKSKLPADEFDDYMAWIVVDKEISCFDEDHFYFLEVYFSKQARNFFTINPLPSFDIKNDAPFYELIKDVIGINDFCCYALSDFEGVVYYHFVPKYFVDKYCPRQIK